MSVRPSSCREIEPGLLASAMGEADPGTTRQVAAHVGECRACREELQRYQAVDGAVAAMRSHEPDTPGVSEARRRLVARLADLRARIVVYGVFPSPLGHILIARSEQGVLLVDYLDQRTSLRASRLARIAGIETVEDGGDVESLFQELREYLDGRRTCLPWLLDLRLVRSDFHRDVLRATSAIPYGAVISYVGLAHQVGRPAAVRAAAQALRWNPLPIVIPCHRVVGASGSLTGYAGRKIGRKQQLLTVEGIPTARMGRDLRIARGAMYVRALGDAEYCLPTCPSLDPLPTRGTLFGSRERAEAAGLLPCSTCRPDLHPIASHPIAQ